MKPSEIVKKINTGMLIKGLLITDDGGATRREERKARYAEYTGCFHIGDVEIGIRPLPTQTVGALSIHWDLSVLHEKDGNKFSRGLNVLTPTELRAMATLREQLDICLAEDNDIDEFFDSLSFSRHGC